MSSGATRLDSAEIIQRFNKSYKHNLEDFLIVYDKIDPTFFIRQIRLTDVCLPSSTSSNSSNSSNLKASSSLVGSDEMLQNGYMKISYLCDEELAKRKHVKSSTVKQLSSTSSSPVEDLIATIPLIKSVSTYDDLYQVMIEMGHQCAATRGLCFYQIDEMVYPWSIGQRGNTAMECVLFWLIQAPWMCAIVGISINYLSGKEIVPSKWLFGFTCLSLLVFIIHITEYYLLVKPYKKWIYYRVPTDYYIEWCIFGLLEGFPCYKRFDRIIKHYDLKQ